MKYTLEEVSRSRLTPATIEKMHSLVKRAKTDPTFVNLIIHIIKNCPPRDDMCQIKRIYKAWDSKIKYVKDPYQVEKVQNVWPIIKNRAGDCDCSSVLIAASVGAIGYTYRFVTIKCDRARKDEWSHVFTQVHVPNQGWISMDITLPNPAFAFTPTGWENKYWNEPAY